MTSSLVIAAFGFGGNELLIILAIVLVLFGGSKLPTLARGLGQSIREFKKASKDEPESEEKTPAAPRKEPAETTKAHGPN